LEQTGRLNPKRFTHPTKLLAMMMICWPEAHLECPHVPFFKVYLPFRLRLTHVVDPAIIYNLQIRIAVHNHR
jgi:hypothetical protein